MREAARDKERLLHIKEAIGRINRYMEGVPVEELQHDDMRYYAVVKNIEIIGEAANLLTTEFRDTHPASQWKMIIGMRNYIIHEYFQVKFDVIKEVLTLDLPELAEQIDTYLLEK
ncbi:MAG: DUF86 domain-containing protein [Bacteroidales bacterium]|nr:DUF86 domain-containing protein [Bacteroidales bacterium]